MESCLTTGEACWRLYLGGKWKGRVRAFWTRKEKLKNKEKRKSLKLNSLLLFPSISWKQIFFLGAGTQMNRTNLLIKLNNALGSKFSVGDENCVRTCSTDALVFSQQHQPPEHSPVAPTSSCPNWINLEQSWAPAYVVKDMLENCSFALVLT